ncbi:TPA: hypothetical protein ACLA9I_001268 [Neisseria meningitidis]
MPSEPPFRRHFTHQNRKTAPKMPSEAVGATILIWGITFLNHPF